ncbi:hypothetical protein VDT04_003475 [Vibrio cholerae]|uniref:hypothetical protein n=1 Tax=Vibrio TaxID=662 RepID=UPI001114C72C|nr:MULTISPECIES: hypothetical protein [Vibrio]EMC4027156.1 hypothetical protein [Vibrio cholerae]NOI07200.1 hypothetical protein [Vibrio anguillarum]WOQ99215.1 hypothetical protein R4537_01455 [Vibrio paracholerae]
MESLLTPTLPSNINSFYEMLVSVAGVLLGIGFAAMLFILQSGFSSFKFSRRMFVMLYLYFGKQVLLSLAYLTIMPFLVLYLADSKQLIAFIHLLFCLFFLVSALDYAKEEGYINTIQGHKFVPSKYGKFRSYFRYIYNRGLLRNIVHLFPPIFVVLYPYILSFKSSFTLELTETAMFYSCLLVLAYTLFKLTMFVPEFFTFTDMEFQSAHMFSEGEAISDESKDKNEKELELLKKYLVNHGVSELSPMSPLAFMDGELTANLISSNNGVAHFNFYVRIHNATPPMVREQVANYGYQFANCLLNSKTDITQYVMSFHVQIATDKQRNLFFRFDRHDFEQAKVKNINNPMCIYDLKNVCIDELFR